MQSRGHPFGSAFTALPRATLVILVACLVTWFVFVATKGAAIWRHLELSAPGILSGQVWQLVTYQILHSPQGLGHVLFNMLGVVFFAPRLERRWGTAGFVRYFLACGVGGGIAFVLVALLVRDPSPVVGASGALLGILMAWALIWPTERVLFMMVIPVQVRHLVLIVGLIDLMMAWLGGMGGSATGAVAHVGGALTGWAYLAHAGRLRALAPGAFRPLERFRRWRRRRHVSIVDRDFEQWLEQQSDDKKH